jgi:acyl-coenzyme A synthetase/AMP-(fatty) acid ligase
MPNITTLLDSKSVPESKPALICPTQRETYSYGRFRKEMNRIAAGLRSLGVKKVTASVYISRAPPNT